MRDRYSSVSSIVVRCEQALAKMPEGRLRISRRGDNIYYYHVKDSKCPNGILLSVDEHSLAKSLAQRTYLESLLKAARIEQQVLKTALDHYPERAMEKIYESYSKDRKDLVDPFTLPDDEYRDKWLAKPYKHMGFKEGAPYFETLNKERVRSKSEQLIADRLFLNGIPYKYECPITLDGMTFHPDFTILRMSDRREIYYEHFGRLDDPSYSDNTVFKLNTYARNGIIMGKNLFATFETGRYPLDITVVEKLIDEVFR